MQIYLLRPGDKNQFKNTRSSVCSTIAVFTSFFFFFFTALQVLQLPLRCSKAIENEIAAVYPSPRKLIASLKLHRNVLEDSHSGILIE